MPFSCYSNSCKSLCAKFIGGCSFILGLMGIIVIVAGAQASGFLPKELVQAMKDAGVDTNFLKQIAVPIIALGALILLISILGCCTAKFKNPCFALPFGLINFILAIVFLVMGLLFMAGEQVQEPLFAVACTQGGNENPAVQFDKLYSTNVDKVMCSVACPCKANPTWEISTNDRLLRTFGRTIKPTVAELKEYRDKQNNARIVPMSFVSTSIIPKYYKTYKECFDMLSTDESSTKTPEEKKFQEWAKTNAFGTIKYLEKELNCAGICRSKLFYVSLPYYQQPKSDCLDGLMKKVAPAVETAGKVCMITAAVLIIAFIGVFPLCSKYNDEEK